MAEGKRVVAYATADVHVPEAHDAGSWVDLPEVRGDVFYALEQVVGLCLTAGVPLLVAGDNFDGPDPDPRTLARLYRTLDPLPDNLYYVLGNHDRGRDWLEPFGRRAVRLDGQVRALGCGLTVTGLSWTHPDGFAELVKKVPTTDVGLYHQTWAEWINGGKGVSVSALPAHKLAVCGDVHVAALINPPAGPAAALSPGPLAPQSTAEFGPAYVWAVHEDCSVTRVPVPGRTYARYEISSEAEAAACLVDLVRTTKNHALPDHLAAPLVAIRFTKDIPGLTDTVRRLAKDKGFSVRLTDGIPAPTQLRKPDDKNLPPVGDLTAAIGRYPDISPAARALAVALTTPGADPAAVLASERARYEAAIHAKQKAKTCSSSASPSTTSGLSPVNVASPSTGG